MNHFTKITIHPRGNKLDFKFDLTKSKFINWIKINNSMKYSPVWFSKIWCCRNISSNVAAPENSKLFIKAGKLLLIKHLWCCHGENIKLLAIGNVPKLMILKAWSCPSPMLEITIKSSVFRWIFSQNCSRMQKY